MNTIKDFANKIADAIDERGLECGSKFQDVEIALEVGANIGNIKLPVDYDWTKNCGVVTTRAADMDELVNRVCDIISDIGLCFYSRAEDVETIFVLANEFGIVEF